MCELFGITSKETIYANSYLKEFFSHSDKHPHGWGIVCMEDNEASIEKEPMDASKSIYLKRRLTLPIEEKTMFAHIRYATIGNVEYQNCHPFSKKDRYGRRWTLIHNGTIFEYAPLSKYVQSQSGDTDSERILLYLVEEINKREEKRDTPMNGQERFAFLDEIVTGMSKDNKLNFLLYDGEFMYVHTNYANSLYYLDRGGTVIFSTQPLSEEEWKSVPFTTLLAYQEGKRIRTGTNHHNEYFENEENMKYIFQIFSNL
ncbi:MAG: class II glutamine amidotransferase [Lachnospiraceae bacterium]|nr:class II glutamine amidotransferase [Lachnospiraceae bacterium]